MVFTNEQLERFKYRSRRLLVEVEEWPKNPDIQAGKIAGEIGAAFSEGYHTAMHEVRSTPWEYETKMTEPDIMNAMSDDGWEFVAPFTEEGMGHAVWRRRKAVAKIANERENQV